MKRLYTRKAVLLCSIAVLAAVYVLQLALENRTNVRTVFTEESIDSVVISRDGEPVVSVQMQDGKWTAGSQHLPAKENRVNGIVNAVSEIKILETVHSGGTDAGRYGLNEEASLKAEAFSGGKKVRTLSVGKSTATGSQCYVQIDDDKKIYLAQGSLRSSLEVSEEDLIEEEKPEAEQE